MNKFKVVTFLGVVLMSGRVFACASCGCSLNTDVTMLGGSSSGWTFDLRYDNLNQNQLRSGTGSISAAQAVSTTNPKTGQLAEVEGYTQNHYLTASIDYNNGESWGVTASIPYISRSHMTYGVDDGTGSVGWPNGSSGYSSDASGFGDIRVVGRYFGFSEQKNWGIQFGLKLPTGNNSQVAASNNGGVTAVDPGLQLGTGSTDLIVGIYKFGVLDNDGDWGYSGNAMYQATIIPSNLPSSIQAINVNSGAFNSGDTQSYRPGNGLNLNLGVNYRGFEKFIPTVQLNYVFKTADTGTAADTWATGGTLVYLTPGLLYPVTESSQLYANIQVPIYQNLNGIQLTPSYIGSIGLRMHF